MAKNNRKIKCVKMVVDITFTESLTKEQVQEVANRVSNALYGEVYNGDGFSPDSDALTEKIRVFIPETILITDIPFAGTKLIRNKTVENL